MSVTLSTWQVRTANERINLAKHTNKNIYINLSKNLGWANSCNNLFLNKCVVKLILTNSMLQILQWRIGLEIDVDNNVFPPMKSNTINFGLNTGF